jgi:hypothetical protein
VRAHLRSPVTWVLVAMLAVLILIEATVYPQDHPVFPWHYMPGYSAAIGFIFALVVVALSKTLGAKFLQRPERHD